METGRAAGECVTVAVDGPLDLRRTLATLGHGPYDPAYRVTPDGVVWRATRLASGAAWEGTRVAPKAEASRAGWGLCDGRGGDQRRTRDGALLSVPRSARRCSACSPGCRPVCG